VFALFRHFPEKGESGEVKLKLLLVERKRTAVPDYQERHVNNFKGKRFPCREMKGVKHPKFQLNYLQGRKACL
jgi:hypothetical protein